eukprot:CAMPEP_0172010352 /NCGR_PEP_ID=MMETSP1041-20130122/7692_1 /TAXON_ID=464988 /ORGANISM="Hemiselmis andersenii, Strain CCMP439" /LENGTH=38 /DNA_ID= /DNA_START= /DNA_END= /DNA_ORIENTATION=
MIKKLVSEERDHERGFDTGRWALSGDGDGGQNSHNKDI